MIIITIIGFLLVIIGLWGLLTQKNIIKMIISFSIMDTGIHIIMVSIGFIKGRTAPIFDKTVQIAEGLDKMIDPIPSALVLTAIVIGLAVTTLMLAYAIQLYKQKNSLSIDDFEELKW
ncbi:MAG: cation:proton antiporter subunit C [Candidatus Cloacimonetes bacterium]|nr:cation:proton antiporter subunit C [Candidatus Cloacimonadota bacterium]